MSITYRSIKGAPLYADEIDGNFKELETRLQQLEEHPERGEGIGKIQLQGDQLTFLGNFGTDFGTVTVPQASLRFHGKWLSQTHYQQRDLITTETSLYYSLNDHTSTTWEQDVTLWQEVLSLPKPPSSSLSLYEKATLPLEESLGKMALLFDEEGTSLIFFNGKTWQRLIKGNIE